MLNDRCPPGPRPAASGQAGLGRAVNESALLGRDVRCRAERGQHAQFGHLVAVLSYLVIVAGNVLAFIASRYRDHWVKHRAARDRHGKKTHWLIGECVILESLPVGIK